MIELLIGAVVIAIPTLTLYLVCCLLGWVLHHRHGSPINMDCATDGLLAILTFIFVCGTLFVAYLIGCVIVNIA